MKKILITHIIGTRPNFMKLLPVYLAAKNIGLRQKIIHSGQHYDKKMSQIFFKDLSLPEPDYNLGIGSESHAKQTALIMLHLEKVINRKSNWVVVYGDCNSTLAGALVASKLGLRIAHVEAGLRSFDRTMPEEINRIVVDQLSELLFTHCPQANRNLLNEGISKRKIKFVGNVMIDTLVKLLPTANKIKIPKYLLKFKRYILVTLHRPSNVDNLLRLKEILLLLNKLSKKMPIIFPIHPRTKKQVEKIINFKKNNDLIFVSPLNYLEFLKLEHEARLVITDSGGVQEETTFLNTPCLTLRKNTERPITVEIGTNIILGENPKNIIKQAIKIIKGNAKKGKIPPLWDGQAGKRIINILKNYKH